MRGNELRNPIELRSPMHIHSVLDLDYVLFPKMVLEEVRGLRLFKTNRVVITHEYLPPANMGSYAKLFDALPDGLQLTYADGKFTAYDLVCFSTYNRNYLERYEIMRKTLESLPVTVPEQELVQDETDFEWYCAGRHGFVYLREPRGLYYQGRCPFGHQAWFSYEIAKTYLCTVVELVSDTLFIAEMNGNQFTVSIRVRDNLDFIYNEGDKVFIEYRGGRYYFVKGE